MATGFGKKKELQIIIGEKMLNKSPWASIYYPSWLWWINFDHSHIGEEYEI